MLRRHDAVEAAGGTCVMVSMNSIGLPAMAALRRESRLPMHGHRNGWGMFDRSPAIGMSYIAYQKFWRLAGIDHMHVNGLQNKFCESDEIGDRVGAGVSHADVRRRRDAAARSCRCSRRANRRGRRRHVCRAIGHHGPDFRLRRGHRGASRRDRGGGGGAARGMGSGGGRHPARGIRARPSRRCGRRSRSSTHEPPVALLLTATTARVPEAHAIGVEGDSRSPEWMSENLPAMFARLKAQGAPICQYRCARAPWIPVVSAAAHLGRYVVFGNLFAAGAGAVHRLDRHPTMSHHPATPMDESNLRRHLARQTEASITLWTCSPCTAAADKRFWQRRRGGCCGRRRPPLRSAARD